MGFEILTADGGDAVQWTALVSGLAPEQRDVHQLPEYGRIYRDAYGFTPLLAVYRGEGGAIAQPFVLRPLRDLPFLAQDAERGTFFDIANAYGFGGPFSNAADPEIGAGLYRRFAPAFGDWCRDQRVASEFACLHPLMQERQRALIGGAPPLVHEKDVVVIDLRNDVESLAGELRKGHRSSIAMARKSGVAVEKVEVSRENLRIFQDVYEQTMARRQAASRWLLPSGYFQQTVDRLGAQRTSLFFARIGGEVESACLLMHDFQTAYYHFAGTAARHPGSGAGNLLVWEAALWAKNAGFDRLHLGGGPTSDADDGVLRFKSGFSSLRAPLYTYFQVHNSAIYDDLAQRKRAFERKQTGVEWTSNFLPIYRR